MLLQFSHRPWGPHENLRAQARVAWSFHALFSSILSGLSGQTGTPYTGTPEDFLSWTKEHRRPTVSQADGFFGIPDEEDE